MFFRSDVFIPEPSNHTIIDTSQLKKTRILQAVKYRVVQIGAHIEAPSLTAVEGKNQPKIGNSFDGINLNHGQPLNATDQSETRVRHSLPAPNPPSIPLRAWLSTPEPSITFWRVNLPPADSRQELK